jgi:hypothetical protein
LARHSRHPQTMISYPLSPLLPHYLLPARCLEGETFFVRC